MNALEFACFFERLQKKIGIKLHNDLIEKIYNYYDGSYENYTLMELIDLLYKKNTKIECRWNKKDIIKMIEDNKLDIPKKRRDISPSTWTYERFSIIVRRTHSIRESYLYVNNSFEFTDDDMIMLEDGCVYFIQIEKRRGSAINSYERIVITLWNFDDYDNREYIMSADDFVHLLDFHNITIIQNRDKNYFDRRYFSNRLEYDE